MDHFHIMLILLIGGFVLLGIGFTNREREWGIRLMGIGVLAMLAPLAFKVYIAFHLK